MDSPKSDWNKRQECELPLPHIYLRLTLLTSTLHVSRRNELYSRLALYVFIMKCYVKWRLIWKKESCVYVSFFSAYYTVW